MNIFHKFNFILFYSYNKFKYAPLSIHYNNRNKFYNYYYHEKIKFMIFKTDNNLKNKYFKKYLKKNTI